MRDTGYVRDPSGVVLLDGVIEGLLEARRLGFDLIQVSNQSGVARGLISGSQLTAVQARFESLLRAGGVELDLVLFCTHGPDEGCACRKPAPGMLVHAARVRNLDLSRSVMVGDKPSDVEAGRAARCATILIGDAPSDAADFRVDSFGRAIEALRSIFERS